MQPLSRKMLYNGLLVLLIMFPTSSSADENCVLRFGGPDHSVPKLSFDQINHADYNALLRHYVDCRGQVCYSRWKKHCRDVNRLGAYLNRLGYVDPSLPASREATLAYYINAYNALTLWGILDSYPVVSIQRLDGKHSSYAIFEDMQFWDGHSYLTLNGIENDVLRPMGDPRIHFALVCAARGCPRLRNEAYSADRIDCQLTNNAVEFFSLKERFQISRFTGKVKISPILKWYREDFGRSDDEVISTVFRFLPNDDRCWLANHPGWKLSYLGYDWGLNDRCPTVSVGLGGVAYRIYAKFSPLISPFFPEKDSNGVASSETTASQNASASQYMPASPGDLLPPPAPGTDPATDAPLLPPTPE